MFAIPTQVGFSHRVVATLVALAVLLWSVGMYTTAEAANLVDVSDTLSDSAPLARPSHSIAFTIPTGSTVTGANTITITFPTGGGAFSTVASTTDVDVTVNGTPDPESGFSAGASTISFAGIAATAGQEVVVAIPAGTITNPSATGSYEIQISTGNGDSGRTRVAIIETVLVTAIVNTRFDFTISGVATSTGVNGTSTSGATTNVAIPFGVLTAGQIKTLGQRLNVSTNAESGFVVTVETDGNLESSNGAIIDNFDEGSDVSEPNTLWNSPVPNVSQRNTWGHWGLTTTDADLNSLGGYYSSEFAANEFIAASTTPRVVFHHNGPADGITNNIGSTTVAYQVEITALQEAADDYSTVLTYIATPTF
jgi:hypothetical protein